LNRKTLDAIFLPSIAALVLLVDQVSKQLIMNALPEGQSWEVVPWLSPVLYLTHVTNSGAAFGLFPKLGGVFIVVATMVVVAIILYYRYLTEGQWLLRLALGLQLGGALGNLIDRLRYGFVVDFLDLNFWPLQNWPVFNFADTAIVSGVALLALSMLIEEFQERNGRAEQPAVEGP
jgi:signal peptidase II